MKHMYMNTRCGYMRIIAGLMVMVMIIVAISINPAFYSYVWAEDEELKESDIVTAGAAGPDIDTPSAILMESKTGQIIYEKDASKQLAPASITKIMTLILIFDALESGQIKMEDPVTVSEHAASMGGSQVYLSEGEQISVEELLKAVCVSSGNDAAVALAEQVAGVTELFVQQMNNRAMELGMGDTHFVNPTGLPAEGHVTSAWDIALMSRELILRHPDIRRFTTIWMDSIRGGEFGLSNTNKLIRFYDGATGLKTGSTDAAGYCISATAEREGMELIAVVLGSETSQQRFVVMARLMRPGETITEVSITPNTDFKRPQL